jgi:alanine racemase
VGVCAVVKADAYGHGAVEVANRLSQEGAAGFAVADVYEALALRDAGVTAPLLTLYAPLPDEAPALVATGAAVGVGAPELARALDGAARAQGVTCAVHINIDTGMGRGGCAPDDALMLAIVIARCPNLRLAGAFTHFAAVSAFDPDTTLKPFARFTAACDHIEAGGFRLRTRHAANSAALFVNPRTHAQMVRPGIALFGVDPGPLGTAGVKLRPALTLRARVIAVNRIPAGTTIGYRPGFTAYQDTRVAVVPIGYADGFPYLLADRGRVLVRGRSARVVGQISMDCTAVDVGHIDGVRVGDVVTLVGPDGDQRVSIEELAEGTGTIPYEIATRIGNRATRRYV